MACSNQELDVEVVVVGAGPVGLALATELGRRGVRSLVLDAGDGAVVFPAGEAIFSRTMEHLRRWGVADEARSTGEPADFPHRIVFMTQVVGHLLATFDNGATNSRPGDFADVAAEGPAFLSKFSFLPLLQRTARAQASVELRYGQTVVGLEQDEDGASVAFVDAASGVTRKARTSYVVGCDGGRSWIRRRVGIEMDGEFAQGQNYAVHFRAPALLRLLEEHAGGWAAQIQTLANPSRPYITVVNGVDEWRLSVYLEADPRPEDAVAWVHAAVGAPIDVEILRAQPWSGHRVVAQRYRSGRVFLAGDAAHLLWPKGGFGANTGIGDAVDLGWKLAAVLAGWGGPALLDSYEAERRPIAVRNVSEASVNRESDAEIAPDPALNRADEVGVAARSEMGERIRQLRGREFRSVGIQLGYRYADSAVVVPDGTPAPPDDPDVYLPSTWPGVRAPHVWIGPNVSMLDLFGEGFVLIDTLPAGEGRDRGPSGWPKWQAAAALRSLPFRAVSLTYTEVQKLYGFGQVLVRPDGHVAWRGDNPADPGTILDQVRGVPQATRAPGEVVSPSITD